MPGNVCVCVSCLSVLISHSCYYTVQVVSSNSWWSRYTHCWIWEYDRRQDCGLMWLGSVTEDAFPGFWLILESLPGAQGPGSHCSPPCPRSGLVWHGLEREAGQISIQMEILQFFLYVSLVLYSLGVYTYFTCLFHNSVAFGFLVVFDHWRKRYP